MFNSYVYIEIQIDKVKRSKKEASLLEKEFLKYIINNEMNIEQ